MCVHAFILFHCHAFSPGLVCMWIYEAALYTIASFQWWCSSNSLHSGSCVRVRVHELGWLQDLNTYCCTSEKKKPLLLTYNQKDFAVEKLCGWNLWAKAGSRQGSAKVASWPAFRNSCDTPNRQSALGTWHMLKKCLELNRAFDERQIAKLQYIIKINKPCEE